MATFPANIHTPSMEGYRKFQTGGGSLKPNVLKKSMKFQLNWNFQRVGWGWGEVEYEFLEEHNAASMYNVQLLNN